MALNRYPGTYAPPEPPDDEEDEDEVDGDDVEF